MAVRGYLPRQASVVRCLGEPWNLYITPCEFHAKETEISSVGTGWAQEESARSPAEKETDRKISYAWHAQRNGELENTYTRTRLKAECRQDCLSESLRVFAIGMMINCHRLASFLYHETNSSRFRISNFGDNATKTGVEGVESSDDSFVIPFDRAELFSRGYGDSGHEIWWESNIQHTGISVAMTGISGELTSSWVTMGSISEQRQRQRQRQVKCTKLSPLSPSRYNTTT